MNNAYQKWLAGEGCCNAHNFINIEVPDCDKHDVCDCENILLEISKLHTDDEILQEEIDAISGGSGITIDAYTKEEADERFQPIGNYLTEHQPLKTINGQVISGTGNIVIEGGSGGSVTVDDELSLTSINPVENKVITGALNGKLDASAYTPTEQVQADWGVTDSGSTAYIKNKPTIPSLDGYATEQWVLDKNYISGVDLSDYALKSEIPTVPTSNTAFTNDAGYITSGDIPTSNSAFTNDMHYVTSAQTANYVTSGNVETQIVNHFWCGTQMEYDQIQTKQNNVLYLIHE